MQRILKIKIPPFSTLFFLCLLTCLFSCKKAKDKTILIPDDFKQWVYFEQNSYWIYNNDLSNKSDCTYVAQKPYFYYTMHYGANHEEITTEYISNTVQSSVIGGFFIPGNVKHVFYLAIREPVYYMISQEK